MANNIENLDAATDMQKRIPTLEDAYKAYANIVKAANDVLLQDFNHAESVHSILKRCSGKLEDFETGHVVIVRKITYDDDIEDDIPFGRGTREVIDEMITEDEYKYRKSILAYFKRVEKTIRRFT